MEMVELVSGSFGSLCGVRNSPHRFSHISLLSFVFCSDFSVMFDFLLFNKFVSVHFGINDVSC